MNLDLNFYIPLKRCSPSRGEILVLSESHRTFFSIPIVQNISIVHCSARSRGGPAIMPPKNPKAAKAKQKPQEEQREESLQAVVSACFVQLEESYS